MTNPNYQSISEKGSQEEHNKEESLEEEPKVSNLELFSDLVIVVSIHVVAAPLEESGFNEFGIYFARVFYLWLAWHMVTLFMNAAVKMQSQNCPIHNFFIFIWMAFVLHMAQGFSINDDAKAIRAYLGLRFFETLIYWRQVRFPFKAIELEDGTKIASVNDDWLSAMQEFVPVMGFTLIFCEFIPLTLAIYFGTNEDLYYPMVLVSMISIVASFLMGALGGIGNRGKMLVNAFDADHLSERYELITLIFTGELCFAAGKPGNPYGSNGVMLMAFAAYLLTFKSFPLHGQIKFWARSVLHSVAGLFLYAGVFCAIPAIGSAFARIIEEGSKPDSEEGEEESEEGNEEGISACDLLCYAAGAFMVFTAMINLINKDPVGENAPVLSSINRGILRILTGVMIWSLAFILPEVVDNKDNATAVLVPLLALVATAIEIWSVGSLKIAI